MSKRVLILVEGQTEERFVKDVLAPAFLAHEVFFFPTILVTKRVKDGSNFKGGITNFEKFRNDADRLLSNNGGALVTMLVDYYGLPQDFPGMATCPTNATSLQRVTHVEKAIAQHFKRPSVFIPFLALHEFEAWLFSSPDELPKVMTEVNKQPDFAAIRACVETPEDINERPEHAPSKRIQKLFPSYRKALHGPNAAGRIGLDKIRSACPHFNDWMYKLELFAKT